MTELRNLADQNRIDTIGSINESTVDNENQLSHVKLLAKSSTMIKSAYG